MPRARHPWAEAGTDDFEYLDTVHGRLGMNYEVEDGEFDAENEGQDQYNAQSSENLGDA